jgi:very-short-patch-repair endonuclease
MRHDDLAARLAARQLGLLTLEQVRRIGFSHDAVRHRVTRGRWTRVRTGVFAVAGVPSTAEQAVLAAVLAAGDPAVASHGTAGWMWDLPLPRRDVIELTTPIERQRRLPGVRAHRSGTLDERDVATVRRVPVTSVARTLLDTSSRIDDATMGAALDHGLRVGSVTLSAMREIARRLPTIAHGRSPARVQRVLAARIPGYDPGDSELETLVWELIASAGLARPVRRYVLRGPTRKFVIDLAYPRERIAIEVDGFEPHRSRTAFDNDRERQNALVLLDWLLLRFTSRSTETHIIDSVANALSVRGAVPEPP